jgi:cytoskeletal protein CcmA (bactofilin family)
MMRLEGRFHGPLTIREDTSLHGKVEGDLRVAPGVVCLVHGMVAGDLEIGAGSVVELRGMVAGSAMNRGRLQVFGVVRGFIQDQGDGTTTITDLVESAAERDRSGHGESR